MSRFLDRRRRDVLALGAITASLGLASCVSGARSERPSAFRRVESGQANVLRSEVDFSIGGQSIRDQIAGRKDVTTHDIRAAMIDKTHVNYDAIHGTQVEYTSRDGRAFLWYPGNRIILRGEWKAEPIFVEYVEKGALIKKFEYSQICFRYGKNTYNPATGSVGDAWECQAFDAYRNHIGEAKSGDVLRLMDRTEPPFVLPTREKLSLEALRSHRRS